MPVGVPPPWPWDEVTLHSLRTIFGQNRLVRRCGNGANGGGGGGEFTIIGIVLPVGSEKL